MCVGGLESKLMGRHRGKSLLAGRAFFGKSGAEEVSTTLMSSQPGGQSAALASLPALSAADSLLSCALCEHCQRNPEAAHVRHHFASGRGQDHADGEAAALRRRGAARRLRDRAQKPARHHVRLDGTGKEARHFHQLDRAAIRLRRLPHQPARHARPQGFFRGHLPRADRRGFGGDGD